MQNVGWRDLRTQFWGREETRKTHLKPAARQNPFHSNSIHILDEAEATRLGAPFRAGLALISVLMLDTLVAVDLDTVETLWHQTGPCALQHQARPTPLDHGISLFNNLASESTSSAQILDPRMEKIVWEYAGPSGRPLHSKTSSSAEVLPNGNVFIVSSNQGRILEVTQDERVVWEFLAAQTTAKPDQRADVLHAERVHLRDLLWLEQPSS